MCCQKTTLMYKIISLLPILAFVNTAFSQSLSDSLFETGKAYYRKDDFPHAGRDFMLAADAAGNKIKKQEYYFYSAAAFAGAKDSAGTLASLSKAIFECGFNDTRALDNEELFGFLYKSASWKKLIKGIKPTYHLSPDKARFYDTDVRHFWESFDMVQKDTAHAESIYRHHYIDNGTLALQDYFVNKMGGNMYSFAYTHGLKNKFYKSIRSNTLKALDYSAYYRKSYRRLKEIFPEALFPDLYFVIGKLNSAGTSGSNGLILAIDQICQSPSTDVSELESWERHFLSPFSNLPATVAHELIHFQQSGMAADTTLLKAAILEGMADFIGELISGHTANERLQQFAKGREKVIWEKFRAEMLLDRAAHWVGNGDEDRPEWPSDLGYWVGYEICKSYYQNAVDKKKAIREMLHIKDYRQFLADSKFEARALKW